MTTSVEPVRQDLAIPSNGDYAAPWSLTDPTDGSSLLSGDETLTIQVKAALSETAPALLALTNTNNPAVTGILLDPEVADNGKFTVTIRRSAMEPLIQAAPNAASVVSYYYDLVVTYSDAFAIVMARGRLDIQMGVTTV